MAKYPTHPHNHTDGGRQSAYFRVRELSFFQKFENFRSEILQYPVLYRRSHHVSPSYIVRIVYTVLCMLEVSAVDPTLEKGVS